jgi:hypothetical protein
MRGSNNIRWWELGAAAILSAIALFWALNGDAGICIKGETSDFLQKMAAALDGTVELGLKLSTALIGGGIAILIGISSGAHMSPRSRTILLIAMLLFGESALLGVWWRLGIANAWFNECLNLISATSMQRLFNGSLYFFLAGLAVALLTILMAATQRGTN